MAQRHTTDPGGHWADTELVVPVDMKLRRAEQQFVIQWPDGQRSVFNAATLRCNCPCAQCRTERQKRAANPLHVLSNAPQGDVTMTGAELVGRYAVKIVWSDGHDTGIFDYRYLRSLDAG